MSLAGAYSAADGVLSVRGSGPDIWGAADGFHFVYLPWEGDVELIARVRSIEKTDPWAKAGLMIRSDLTAFSPHAMVAMTPEKGATLLRRMRVSETTKDDAHQAMRMVSAQGAVTFQQRGSGGVAGATGSITTVRLPRWIKLVRNGDVVVGYDSPDGATWDWLGSERVPLGERVFVGLAVTSHDASQSCLSTFDEVSVRRPLSSLAAPPRPGTGDGLTASYYPSMDLSGQPVERVEAQVDWDWGTSSPVAGIGKDSFSVSWEGELGAQFTEPYALHVVSDDRARLWLDGQLIIDEWYEHAESTCTAIVNLEAGRRYVLRLEYFENRGKALVRLLWSSPSTPQQVIPQAQLYSRIPEGKLRQVRARYGDDLNPPPSPTRSPGVPEPWMNQDVGQVGQVGSAECADGLWTVAGAGADIWANADGFHFVCQPWQGDVEITARVLSQDPTDPWAKAGIMVRESLAGSARHVAVAVTPAHGVQFLHRNQFARNSSLDSATSVGLPCWIRLIRRGNAIVSCTSADGTSWEWVGTEATDLPANAYVGLAVNSHDNSVCGTVTFDHVSVTAPVSTESVQGFIGTGDGLRATYFDAASGKLVSRIDPTVDFDWDTGSPAHGIGSDRFSVRWEGLLEPQFDEPYAIHIVSDDGARLWLDDQLLVDGWADHGAEQVTARVDLVAGRRYALRLEFYERVGQAMMRLLWSSPSTPKQPVATSQLHSSGPAALPSASTADAAAAGTDTTHKTAPSEEATALAQALDAEARRDVASKITKVVTVAEKHGESALARLGRWEVNGTSLYALDRRGYVEYEVSAPAADVYQLEVEGTSHNQRDLDRAFLLLIWMDGEYLGRRLLDAGFGTPGVARILTPWVKAGPHRVRVYWDNARRGRSFELAAVRLQELQGPDADGDGVKDWTGEWLRKTCGVEAPESRSSVIYSASSPVCLEGRGRYLSMLQVASGQGSTIKAQPAAGDRWYADVPLAADRPTPLEVSYENGGYRETRSLVWKPTNLLEAEDQTIRVGDGLLLVAAPPGAGTDPASTGTMTIEVEGAAPHTGEASVPHECRFGQPGSFGVKGTYTDPQGGDSPDAVASASTQSPSELVDGICGPHAYQRLRDLVARTDLSQAECRALYDFLRTRTTDEKLERMASIKSTVMAVLDQQTNHPSPWDGVLEEIYSDPDQHPVIRDYALQHLLTCYETVVEKGGAGSPDPARRSELLALFWKALDQTNESIAGTSLLGLFYLSDLEPAVDREQVKTRALALAEETTVSDLVRISAFQVCASLECVPALPSALTAARDSGNLALRTSAVAAIGALGTARELPFLDQLAREANPGIQRAVTEARRRLQAKSGDKRL